MEKEIILDKQYEEEKVQENLPSFTVAILPIISVLVISFICSKFVYPSVNLEYLKEYNTTSGKVVGNWSLIIALIFSIVIALVLNYKRMNNILKTINNGVQGSFLAIMNTASEVGYGNVIASLAAFSIVKMAIIGISSNPLISEAVSVSSLAGITGSASGGLSIALEALGETYLKEANLMGISPEVLHRISAMACGGLDTLPHNGAVITLLAVTGLTHKESYIDIGVCTVIIPAIAVGVCIFLSQFGII
ncbi:MAG: hypothetical protein RSB50_09290 [Cetobacterium sp.]